MKKLILSLAVLMLGTFANADIVETISADKYSIGLSLKFGIAPNGKDAIIKVTEKTYACPNTRTASRCHYNRGYIKADDLKYDSYKQTITYRGVVCATVENVYNGFPNGASFMYAKTKATGNCPISLSKSQGEYTFRLTTK